MSSSYSSLDWVLSHWAHVTVHRFVSMVGWTWWDWSLILRTYLPSVLWHCWLNHLIHKNPSPIWPITCLVGRYTLLNPILLNALLDKIRNFLCIIYSLWIFPLSCIIIQNLSGRCPSLLPFSSTFIIDKPYIYLLVCWTILKLCFRLMAGQWNLKFFRCQIFRGGRKIFESSF